LAETPKAIDEASMDPRYCGGELAAGALTRYRARLDIYLASSEQVAPPDLLGETFIYLDRDGSSLSGRSAVRRVARADWRLISQHLADDFHDAGWRGCCLGDGWAVFQANESGSLVLSIFDHSRASKVAQQVRAVPA